jgi:hypothetical protein
MSEWPPWPIEAQLVLSAAVFVGYALGMRTLVKREEKALGEIFDQRTDFLDRMWESRLPVEHLYAAGVVSRPLTTAPLASR